MIALTLTLAALSIWLYQDAERRQMNSPLSWVVLLWLLGPLAMAMYWGQRPLFAGEQRVGGRTWVTLRAFLVALAAWGVVFFAVFSVWLSSFVPAVALMALLFGLSLLLGGSWFVVAIGFLLLAWMMQDRANVEYGPTHAALAGVSRPVPGDRLLKVIFLGGIIAAYVFTEPTHPQWVESVDWEAVSPHVMI